MKAPTRYVESRGRHPRLAICVIGFAVSVLAAGGSAAQGLPETVRGRAQIYDGVTFGLIQGGGRYRTTTRTRFEAGASAISGKKRALYRASWSRRPSVGRPALFQRWYRVQCYVDKIDIAALGLGQGMDVLAVSEYERPLPGYAEVEAMAKAARAGICRVNSCSLPSGVAPMAGIILLSHNDG